MGLLSVLSCAHRWAGDKLRPGDVAVDATVGTGVDTVFLCRAVGPKGLVFGFDVQQAALDQAAARAACEPGGAPGLRLLLRSHAEMAEALPPDIQGRVAAVMFNLGYLPGGDERLITQPSSSIAALDAALSLLKPGGIVTVVVYPGHAGGAEEAGQVEQWAAALPEGQYRTALYRFMNRSGNPPYVIAAERRNR